MIFYYRIFYFITKTILIFLNPLLPQKIQAWIHLRKTQIEKKHKFNKSYWFHASSGEIEYCKSVIRLLKEQQPNSQIVLTYSSPSAEKLFHNIQSYVDQFIPLCWDQPKELIELINYINPQVLIFSRTDLWPELIVQTSKKNIRLGVISYHPKFNFINNIFNRQLLKQMNFISVLDQNIKNELINSGIKNHISIDGDTRFDQVFYRLSQEPKLKFTAPSNEKIFVCGSTWPEDEKVLFQCFQELINAKIKIILCPHEVNPKAILHLKNELEKYQLSYQFLSNETNYLEISLLKNIFIIDQVGYLADAYRDASVAFVGGSYKEKIHSVMEPLCCGLPVITGPYYQNNPEAVRYKKIYVFPTADHAEIVNIFPKLLLIQKANLMSEMKKNLNSCKRVLDLMRQ